MQEESHKGGGQRELPRNRALLPQIPHTAVRCVWSPQVPANKSTCPRFILYLSLKLRVMLREDPERSEGDLVVREDDVRLVEPFRDSILPCTLAAGFYDGRRRLRSGRLGRGRFVLLVQW